MHIWAGKISADELVKGLEDSARARRLREAGKPIKFIVDYFKGSDHNLDIEVRPILMFNPSDTILFQCLHP